MVTRRVMILVLFIGALGAGTPAACRTLRREMSVAEAEALHSRIKKHGLFKHIYGKDGCYSRASVASFILDDEEAIYSQLVWVHGCEMIPRAFWNSDLQTRWVSHVASLVRVRTLSGRLESWVMDLSFRGPMPLRTWLKRLNISEPLALSPDEAMYNPPPFRCIFTTTERYQHLSPRGIKWTNWKAAHLFHNVELLDRFAELQASLR